MTYEYKHDGVITVRRLKKITNEDVFRDNKQVLNQIDEAYQRHKKLKLKNIIRMRDEVLMLLNTISLEDLKKEMEIVRKSIKKDISDEGVLSILLKILQKNKRNE